MSPPLRIHVNPDLEAALGRGLGGRGLGDIVFKPRPPDLAALRFRAEANPVGPAIDLVWDLADPTASPDALPVRIMRRVRRYPGRSRRGVVATLASVGDLADGTVVLAPGTLVWDIEETREDVEGDRRIATTRQYTYRGTPRDRVLVRSIRREYALASAAPRRTTVRVVDRTGLAPGTIYYYTAFAGSPPWFSSRTQASALATGSGTPDLFTLLPRVDQQRDETAPDPFAVPNSEHDRGQLERLLRVVQAHADLLLGLADGLHDIHDSRRADARLLGPMAALIAWRLKADLDEDGQRAEIAFAPEVYRAVGTAPLLAAMVNRLTGWPVATRDFVRNVLVTWDPERRERRGAGWSYLDGSDRAVGDPPTLITQAVPAGTVNTADVAALTRLRIHDPTDTTAFTYDCGPFDATLGDYAPDDDTWYDRHAVGVYVRPPAGADLAAVRATWARAKALVAEFLPIHTRAVLVVRP